MSNTKNGLASDAQMMKFMSNNSAADIKRKKANRNIRARRKSQRQRRFMLLDEHTVGIVKYSDVRAKLSKMVAEAHGFIEVKNRQSGDFLAISLEEMESFLSEILMVQPQRPSFFDGIDEFDSGEPISYDVIGKMKTNPPEYTKKDIEHLKTLLNDDKD